MQKKNIIVSKHTQKKTKDIQRIRSASHHQKWAKVASQQAPDAAGDQSKEEEKKKTGGGVLPIKFIQKKGEEEEGQRDAEGSASPHEDVKKHKHEVEKRERGWEWTIYLRVKYLEQHSRYIRHTSERPPTPKLTVHKQERRNHEWCENERREERGWMAERERDRGWGVQVSFLKKKQIFDNKNI